VPDKEKKPLSETAVDRKVADAVRAIQEAQAKRDAEQDAKLARPSMAVQAVKALDVTERYPLVAWAIGIAFVVGALVWLEGVKLYIGAGVGVCFVPGLAGKVVRLATGLKKAKGDA
jgi:hypothetical protein